MTESYPASEEFKDCPFCEKHDGLIVHRTSENITSWIFDPDHSQICIEYGFSLYCEHCNLIFGVTMSGTSVFGTEKELRTEWNRRT